MSKLRFIFLSICFTALTLSSCSKVHEFPEKGKEVDPTCIKTRIKITRKKELQGRDIYTKSTGIEYDCRYIICIKANEYSDSVIFNDIITKPASDTSSFYVDTDLKARKYKLAVWMDYIPKGSKEDCFYHTGNGTSLNTIHILEKEKYVAGNDYKDTQSFTKDIDLTVYAGQWRAETTILAPLSRPMAKISLMANDLEEYAESIGYKGSLEELAGSMTVEIIYNGYFPSGFNAFTGRLNDSQTGYSFKMNGSYPVEIEHTQYMNAGSDYVFVNGESSSVNISAVVRNKSGNIINEVYNINVPITRDRETVIIYRLLTKEYVPGIGINPEFDGEFNVYV